MTNQIPKQEQNKSERLSRKIKLMKGLEIACLSGMIAGAGLLFAGAAKDNDKQFYTGTGVYAFSLLAGGYASTKKTFYKTKKSVEDVRIRLQYPDNKTEGAKQ